MFRDQQGRERARVVPFPRPDGGVRWIARIDPSDARDYTLAVATIAPSIEGALAAGVMANRVVGRGSARCTTLEPWRPALREFRRSAARMRRPSEGAWTLVLDVRECYASISTTAVETSLLDLGCDRAKVRSLLRLLERFGEDGVRGLPIGPDPSAILANAVLSAADRAIERSGARFVRWVDDYVVAASTERNARRALDAAGECLASLGLETHGEKTRIETAGARGGFRFSRVAGEGP